MLDSPKVVPTLINAELPLLLIGSNMKINDLRKVK